MRTSAAEKSNCPICDGEVKTKAMRMLYNVPVCKKCRNGFANRRQGAYILDYICLWMLSALFGVGLGILFPEAFDSNRPHSTAMEWFWLAYTWLLIPLFFALKDGMHGYSPGKRVCGVRAVDGDTLEPIGFGRSFKRNLWFLLPIAPLIILVQMIKGRRLGDKWARTKVIWSKYKHRVPFDTRGVLCQGCGYNLTGNVSGRCPECGLDLPRVASPAILPPEPQPALARAIQ